MNSLFPAHKDVHETYDLKSSTVGGEYPEERVAKNPRRATLKDPNWIDRGKTLELGPENRSLLTEQLRRDAEVLKAFGVMDYSLLIDIHHMQRGNKDNVRRNAFHVFSVSVPRPAVRVAPHAYPFPLPSRARATQPDVFLINGKKAIGKGPQSPEAIAMRCIMRAADPQSPGAATIMGERQHLIFYRDESGLRATDEANENVDTIYYLGVVDFPTRQDGQGVQLVQRRARGARRDDQRRQLFSRR